MLQELMGGTFGVPLCPLKTNKTQEKGVTKNTE